MQKFNYEFLKVSSRLSLTVPFSLERAARIAARMLPAGGDEKTWPTTAAVKRPCPTNPIGEKSTCIYEQRAVLSSQKFSFYRQRKVRDHRRPQQQLQFCRLEPCPEKKKTKVSF